MNVNFLNFGTYLAAFPLVFDEIGICSFKNDELFEFDEVLNRIELE